MENTEKKDKVVVLGNEDIVTAIVEVLKNSDADTVCSIAENVLGGKYRYDVEMEEYHFTKDKDYAGAFSYLEKESVE